MGGNFGENVILLCLSLFAGIIIHVFANRLLKIKKFKWFENIVYISVKKISITNEAIQPIIPFLNKEYCRLKQHEIEQSNEYEACEKLFDFAYYYLEANDKISAAKNFQSLYFWFRNMFTISVFLIPGSLIILSLTFFGTYIKGQIDTAICISVINLVLFFILIPNTRWLRELMVKKVLWSYYVERIHQNENKSNNNQ
ncbi:MAG: hypothetical protein A2033_10200 [Bacteroidetes bacterium GWA2_31_9]|nr:MAG: hypothetical protein A2033_10200 [Bacteroidetes bacterium GWA2_31_9]